MPSIDGIRNLARMEWKDFNGFSEDEKARVIREAGNEMDSLGFDVITMVRDIKNAEFHVCRAFMLIDCVALKLVSPNISERAFDEIGECLDVILDNVI